MKSKTYDIDKAALEQWYLVEHLTMAQIGEKLGMSRQGVLYQLKRHCVDRRQAEKFPVVCEGCGKTFDIGRKRWKVSKHRYCSRPCMFDAKKRLKAFLRETTTTAPADAVVPGVPLVDVLTDALCEGCPAEERVHVYPEELWKDSPGFKDDISTLDPPNIDLFDPCSCCPLADGCSGDCPKVSDLDKSG